MDADTSLIVASLTDFIGKIGIPLIVIVCTTILSLFSIHRADERERDKQRRDDLGKTAIDFFKLGARAEESLIGLTKACELGNREAILGAKEKMRKEFFDLRNGLEALDTHLTLFGEENLRAGLSEYQKKAIRCGEDICRWADSPGQFYASLATQEIEGVHEDRKKVARAFADELQRLRLAGRQSFITRLFDSFARLLGWFPRQAARVRDWYKCL